MLGLIAASFKTLADKGAAAIPVISGCRMAFRCYHPNQLNQQSLASICRSLRMERGKEVPQYVPNLQYASFVALHRAGGCQEPRHDAGVKSPLLSSSVEWASACPLHPSSRQYLVHSRNPYRRRHGAGRSSNGKIAQGANTFRVKSCYHQATLLLSFHCGCRVTAPEHL